MTRWIFLVSVTLTLGGCAVGFGNDLPPRLANPIAWDGLGPDPRRPVQPVRAVQNAAFKKAEISKSPAREAELATFPEFSPEWRKINDEIQAEADARLAKRLIICRGCGASNSGDHTGSIN